MGHALTCNALASSLGNVHVFELPDQVCCDALTASLMTGVAYSPDVAQFGGWSNVAPMVGVSACLVTEALTTAVDGAACGTDPDHVLDTPSLSLVNAYVCSRWTEGCAPVCSAADGMVATMAESFAAPQMWASLGCNGDLPATPDRFLECEATTTTTPTTTTASPTPSPTPLPTASPTPSAEDGSFDDSVSHAASSSAAVVGGVLVSRLIF